MALANRMPPVNNTPEPFEVNRTETLSELNARFAEHLLPLTVTFGGFTVLGFFGNLLILLVFSLSREYRKNNFRIFVLTLAIIDFITCLTLIPAEMLKHRHYFDFSDASSCKVKCFFNVFGSSASCLALLVISIDRYRKVVQPLKKQLSPSLAIKVLFVIAFLCPVLLSIPGTMMCGIKRTAKTNIYGSNTDIYLCETEDKYRHSVLRTVYKFSLLIMMAGISLVYVVLYTFVMREVTKQVRYTASQRKNSGYDVTYSSDVYDPNAVNLIQGDPLQFSRKSSARSLDNVSPQLTPTLKVKETKAKKVSRQHSMRSFRSLRNMPILKRKYFPSKTFIWFILTLVFILTYVTHIVLSLRVGEVVKMEPGEFSLYSFFYRIYFFNHMVNPFVYAIFHKRFRDSCVHIVKRVKSKVIECSEK